MALFYGDIIEFINNVAMKMRLVPKPMTPWPTSEDQWDALSDEQQTVVRTELDDMLCKLGRHDYEYVEDTGDGYNLKCFYCLAVKHTNGGKQ